MSFAVQSANAKADGLFLLYFLPDFQARQSFYCFMYQELRPTAESQQSIDLQTLDGVLSTFRVTSATESSPPIPPGPQSPVGRRAGEDLVISKRQPEVDAPQRLSADRAGRQPDTILDAKAIAAKCARNVDNARTYGSLATLIDRGSPELAAHNTPGSYGRST
jgi:hypothetical protein